MAITDESYFDWPVLPEAPSGLQATQAGRSVALSWEVHGGDAAGMVVERTLGAESDTSSEWEKIASLGAKASEYRDNTLRKGQKAAYRVRALNSAGESAYSNVVRVTAD